MNRQLKFVFKDMTLDDFLYENQPTGTCQDNNRVFNVLLTWSNKKSYNDNIEKILLTHLIDMKKNDILKLKNFGKKSIEKVIDMLLRYDITDIKDWGCFQKDQKRSK